MANGWAELGQLVAGGGNDGSQAYADQMRRIGLAQDAQAKARIARARAINQEGITPELFMGAGIDPGQAALAARVVGAATTPNVRNAGLSELADIALQREAAEAARTGNLDRMNAITAVKSDKLMERTRITAGQAYDPYAPSTQTVQLTPLGQADAAAEYALGDQRHAGGQAAMIRANAAAQRDAARAGVYEAQEAAGGFRPLKGDAPLGSAPLQSAVASDGFVSFDDIPDEARMRLKEGFKTRFDNGQVWTLVDGQPTRVQ